MLRSFFSENDVYLKRCTMLWSELLYSWVFFCVILNCMQIIEIIIDYSEHNKDKYIYVFNILWMIDNESNLNSSSLTVKCFFLQLYSKKYILCIYVYIHRIGKPILWSSEVRHLAKAQENKNFSNPSGIIKNLLTNMQPRSTLIF